MAYIEKANSWKSSTGKTPTQKAPTIATEQMIRDRARQIWEKMGKPQNQDLAIWYRAEKELQGS